VKKIAEKHSHKTQEASEYWRFVSIPLPKRKPPHVESAKLGFGLNFPKTKGLK
jgi:hypothetical protein